MQRRDLALVASVRIGTGLDQIGDRRGLGGRIPAGRARHAIGGVVKRSGAATVLRADVGAAANQAPCEITAVAGGGDMERGVADVQVVLDLVEVVVVRMLSRRCVLRARDCEPR